MNDERAIRLAAARLARTPDFVRVMDAFIADRKEMVFNIPLQQPEMIRLAVMQVHSLEELKTYIGTLATEEGEENGE